MNLSDPSEVARKIAELREEHRDLDRAIAELVESPSVDQLRCAAPEEAQTQAA